jgi:opacity protein-like surface antigen
LTSSDWYLGGLYSFQKVSMKDIDTLGINNAGIIAGYKVNEIFSLEYRLSTSTSGDSLNYPTLPSAKEEQEIDYQVGLLAKASYNITTVFSIYGLAGYDKTKAHIKFEGKATDFEGNVTSSYTRNYAKNIEGLTYGLGLNYKLTNELNIFIDYQVLPEPNAANGPIKTSRNSASLGVYYSF